MAHCSLTEPQAVHSLCLAPAGDRLVGPRMSLCCGSWEFGVLRAIGLTMPQLVRVYIYEVSASLPQLHPRCAAEPRVLCRIRACCTPRRGIPEA